ncbi:phosphoribosylanthranilate isomerase [uncultured Rubinisphaera sp.]|uniref:phosphoribosylanthranilate isomerase n=1 Tax=uncultured Rubinisphaera sp. TaxID=1678686 RepID=UPI0030D6E9F6
MWIKICGIRSVQDAEVVSRFQPAAIGLNFYQKSPRSVTRELAREIIRNIPDPIERVGVFVDQTPAEIAEIANELSLTHVQLHGDYLPEHLVALKKHSIIWVYRMGREGITPLLSQLDSLQQNQISVTACLIDARVPGLYGGSGQTVDWESLVREYDQEKLPKLILAGGLVPENIAEAISMVNPWGVDVASGVERDDRKDAHLIEQFLMNATSAV